MKWKCIIFYMITLQMGHLAQDAYFLKNLIRLYNFSDYSSEHILNYLVTTQFFFLIMSLARLLDFHSLVTAETELFCLASIVNTKVNKEKKR